MTASRIGKPGVAVFVSLAVPLELFAGGAQPHIENEVRQPGYYNFTVPPVSGSNVSAQSVSVHLDFQREPVTVAHKVPDQATRHEISHPDFFSTPVSICPRPRYDLSSREKAVLRSNGHARFCTALRGGHTIRGQC